MKNDASKTLAWVFAAITCPCHLFILVLVLAGTAAGVFVTSYFVPLLIISLVVFGVSVSRALKM